MVRVAGQSDFTALGVDAEQGRIGAAEAVSQLGTGVGIVVNIGGVCRGGGVNNLACA